MCGSGSKPKCHGSATLDPDRIDIILADQDRHPEPADPDPDPYPFQPKAAPITHQCCESGSAWIRIRFAAYRINMKRRIRICLQVMRFRYTVSNFPSVAITLTVGTLSKTKKSASSCLCLVRHGHVLCEDEGSLFAYLSPVLGIRIRMFWSSRFWIMILTFYLKCVERTEIMIAK
jgi:hypothetical protein